MNLTELPINQLGLISCIDYNDDNIEDLYKVMRLGIVGGLEIRKLGEVATCAEYRVEGCGGQSVVIDKCLSDYIKVEPLDETVD